MARVYKIAIISTLAVLVLVTAFCMRRLFAESRNLVERSHYAGSVKNWSFHGGHDPYRWLTDTTVIATLDKTTPPSGSYDTLSDTTVFTYDTRTQTMHVDEPLSKLFAGPKNVPHVGSWDLSSDLKRVLWFTQGDNTVHSATVAGGDYRSWRLDAGKRSTVYRVSWLTTGYSWVAAVNTASGQCYYAYADEVPGQAPAAPRRISETDADQMLTADAIDWQTAAGFSVQVQNTAEARGRITKLFPAGPAGLRVCEVDASLDHKHLAWLAQGQHTPPIDRLLHSVWPAYGSQTRIFTALYISNFDGSGLKEVGRIDVPAYYPQADNPKALDWLPSGTQVSYFDNDKLYVLNVHEYL
jgi:hypothetical protein